MFSTILVPVDLGEVSREACQVACGLAAAHGASLAFLYILPDYGYPVVAQYFDAGQEEQALAESEKALAEFVKGQELKGVKHQMMVRKGRIYEEVLDAAEEAGADLIVIASRSPKGIDRFMMGSNAEKVARYAKCSVLLLRH